MTDSIFTYLVRFPCRCTKEAVLPCLDGYTIYIDERLSREEQVMAYRHALEHIKNRDFEKTDVNQIEMEMCRKGL